MKTSARQLRTKLFSKVPWMDVLDVKITGRLFPLANWRFQLEEQEGMDVLVKTFTSRKRTREQRKRGKSLHWNRICWRQKVRKQTLKESLQLIDGASQYIVRDTVHSVQTGRIIYRLKKNRKMIDFEIPFT